MWFPKFQYEFLMLDFPNIGNCDEVKASAYALADPDGNVGEA